MPAMLKRISDGAPATKVIGESEEQGVELKASALRSSGGIPEDEEAEFEKPQQPQAKQGFTWRIDLSLSEPFWEGWFKGLSATFLRCPCPKLLLLAGIDRLDKDLTIGQMQGKFQTQVLPKVGHAVQEDAPDKVRNASMLRLTQPNSIRFTLINDCPLRAKSRSTRITLSIS